jgi:outer membrane protein insertion porin family/translocation and assembly module TamA
VDITGNDAIDADDLREKLATAESPRFLGFFQGVVYDYNVFDRFVLERDLQRIERFYRAKGYYQARARAGRVFFVKSNQVRVDIQIEEGEPVLVQRLDLHGVEGLDKNKLKRLQKRITRRVCGTATDACQGKPGGPFEEDRFVKAAELLQHELEDEGYAYATVTRAADVDLPKNRVAVGYFVKSGPRARYGKVTIVGLGKVPEEPVRRALDLQEKEPYSRTELDSAERALLDMNVFSSVVITPELAKDGATQTDAVVPIQVTVETAKLKAIHVGGGAEVDSLKSDLHLVGGWEHRNLFGGLRSLTFEVKPGVVLYPTRFPSLKTPTKLLPEGKFNLQFRQPGFVEARTGLFTRLDGSIAPVILSPDQTDDRIVGYRDIRLAVGVDRSWNSVHIYGSVAPTIQYDSPFWYAGERDPDLLPVTIFYPEIYAAFDLRDKPTQAHEGVFISQNFQFATLATAHDVKTQTDVRGYIPVARKWTVALRARAGLLFPQNYGSTIEDTAHGADFSSNGRRSWVQDIQLMFLRGFFAGGAGSNRGYALREIGPHGIVPQATSTLATCDPTMPGTSCKLPLGGFTLWEASVELRFPLKGALTGALFTDAADVSDRQVDFRLDRPHLSSGLGLRYDTPVGPIRLDAGYRIPGLQAPANAEDEGIPESNLFGQPIALSFGIGEAF